MSQIQRFSISLKKDFYYLPHMKHFEDFEREANQYPKILERYKKKGIVFKDPNFHPTGNIKEPKVEFNEKDHIWERIDKYYTVPLFKREAISEDAIQQGELGTCYFIASLCRIARQPELVELLFDTRTRSKSKKGKKDEFVDTINLKCGAVVVYFHAFGRLTPVLIDTLVPFKRGTRRPRFVHPADIKYSPWFCLVEKAFAKLHGSYSLIVGGALSSAIYHLFGYFPCYKRISEMLEKREKKLKEKQELDKSLKNKTFDKNECLFSQLMQWQRENAVLGADITLDKLQDGVTEDDVIDNGLVTGHAYLIMKVRREQNKNFICLRNPWGDHEWLGDWSDTSQLWTPELKKALGVHSKDDGTFWMIDKDFFKYFSSFDVAKPVNPEFHTKSFMTRLDPGHSDGKPLDSKECDLEHHQTFVFKLKNAQIKSDIKSDTKDDEDSLSSDSGKGKNKKDMVTVDDIKVYIRIEKRSPRMDSATDTILEKPTYAMFIVYSDGKKLEFDQLKYYYRSWLSTSNQFFRSTHHIKYNKPFVIVFQRLTKCDYTEECYVQFSCKYDFELYDHDYPDSPFKEDEKFGVVFNNKSKRYKNIAKDLRVKKIGGKDVQAFATLNTTEFDEAFYKNLKYNYDSENSNRIYEYDISGTGESEAEQKKKKKGKKSDNNQDSKKEMKKILEKKKEVEEMEKEVEQEKKKLEEEKNKILMKEKEIQKENEKLVEEKKKFEEEKKKSSKQLREKSENENKSQKGKKDDELGDDVIIGDRSLDFPVDGTPDDKSNDKKIGKNETKGKSSNKQKLNKNPSKKEMKKSSKESSDESSESEDKQKASKNANNRNKKAAKKASNQSESSDEYSESEDKPKTGKNTNNRNKKAAKKASDKSESSDEYSESEDKPKTGKNANNRNKKAAKKGSNQSESSDESSGRKQPKRNAQANRKQSSPNTAKKVGRKQVSDSEHDESDSEPRSKNTKKPTKTAAQQKNKQNPERKRQAQESDSSYYESESDDKNKNVKKGKTQQKQQRKTAPPKRRISRQAYSSDYESESEDTNKKQTNKKVQQKQQRKTAPPKRRISRRSDSSDYESEETNKRQTKNKAQQQQKRKQPPTTRRRVQESDYSSYDSESEERNKRPTKVKTQQKQQQNKPAPTKRRASRPKDSSDYESDSEETNKRQPKGKNQQKQQVRKPTTGKRRAAQDSDSDSYSDYSDSDQIKQKAKTKNGRQSETTNKNRAQRAASPKRRAADSYSESESESTPPLARRAKNKQANTKRKVAEESDDSESNNRTRNKGQNQRRNPNQARRKNSQPESDSSDHNIRRKNKK